MTLEEIEKKADEYARKTMKVDWEGFPIDKDARKEAYIAGATEVCSSCCMNFKDMMKESPTEAGRYLVIRNKYGVKWSEVLMFDGKFWVTGLYDDPKAFIVKWCKLEA